MSKLRLGVLGLGEGRSIISAALASEMWELAQICDLNEQLCKDRAAEFRFGRYTTSMDDMLADDSIDVIGIYTPDPMHAHHIRACLDAGKHVICTKPLIDNLRDATQLLDAQRRANKHVFVGQSTRFFEPMMRQRADYDAGKHGSLFSVEAHYHADHRWFLNKQWAKAGGLKWLYGGFSHPVDLIRWYLPDVTEVMGYGLLTEPGQAVGLAHPDAMHFVLTTTSGKIGRVSGAYSSPPGNHARDSHMTCCLRGTRGTTHADYYDLRYSTQFTGEGSVQYDLANKEPYYFRFPGRSHHAGEYQNYIEYFARSLQAGQTPKPDLIEGIGTVALLTAMERSLDTNRPVTVRSVLEAHGLNHLL
ncbi:MAG TPA: Gfo/Idh/MocA family oxidoreductase [Tepidisphaeraceae bacterium]|nr:Gfo/Idh/MocA family oxidoreductase [Tepidisphaeraceae bacterium]